MSRRRRGQGGRVDEGDPGGGDAIERNGSAGDETGAGRETRQALG